MNTSSIILWTIVALLGLLFVIDIFLIAFLRFNTPISSQQQNATPTPSVSSSPVFPNITIRALSTKATNIFTMGDVNAAISPVVPIVDSSVSVTNASPTIPPNMVPPSHTFSAPLQITPQSLGFVCMPRDGTQLLSSLPNGEQSFAQFQLAPDSDVYSFFTNGYVADPTTPNNPGISNSNRIVKDDGNGNDVLNTFASAVGSVGLRSIVLSIDNLRLYVSYRDPSMGTDSLYPFEAIGAKVQTWRRTDPKSESWQHLTDIVNPFPNVPQFQLLFNSFWNVNVSGDNFGDFLQTYGHYGIAIGTQSSVLRASSDQQRCIVLMTEQNDFSYATDSILCLPNDPSVSVADLESFGTVFAVSGDGTTCVASLGGYGGVRRVAHFDKIDTLWTFVGFLNAPSSPTNQIFATSICLDASGTKCIIGSPSAPTQPNAIPVGGNVYVYKNSGNGFELLDTVSDPFLTNQSFPNTRTFGWFVNVDPDWRVLTVSANQNSLYIDPFPLTKPPNATCTFAADGTPLSPCTYTVIEAFAIDQISGKIDQTHVARAFQDTGGLDFIDPLFGARVEMALEENPAILFLAGSPLNQKMTLFQMARS